MKYTKQNIEKQRKVLSSDKVRKNSSVSLFLFKYVFIFLKLRLIHIGGNCMKIDTQSDYVFI